MVGQGFFVGGGELGVGGQGFDHLLAGVGAETPLISLSLLSMSASNSSSDGGAPRCFFVTAPTAPLVSTSPRWRSAAVRTDLDRAFPVAFFASGLRS